MIHALSRATSYLQTFYIRADTGEHCLRSYATGFFIRTKNSILLLTNWHVVTGLDPANPSVQSNPSPIYLKATIYSKSNNLTELTVPLYDAEMRPIWREHSSGSKVDLAIIDLPAELEQHYHFFDVLAAEDEGEISEIIAKEVFIIGYPFRRDEIQTTFGDDAAYYLPVWKRGSIATEPSVRLGGHVLLIDSLSRAGMSGSPVVIAEDVGTMRATTPENDRILRKMFDKGSGKFDAIGALDTTALAHEQVKRFRFLGVYSGTIGNTRLAEVALGKCWHHSVLQEMLLNHRAGVMTHHALEVNSHYSDFFEQLPARMLIIQDKDGKVIKREGL